MGTKPRFRGENFQGKWSLGSWAEKHIISAINATEELRATPYGKSEVGPSDTKAIGPYWTEYKDREEYGKRPDILVFERTVFEKHQSAGFRLIREELPNYSERDIHEIVSSALLGVESEASIWQGEKMPHYGRSWWNRTGKSKPVRELKKWTAPTVIVKDEDLHPLIDWKSAYKKPIYVVHLFYDMAFMLNFDKLLEYIADGTVKAEEYDYGKAKKTIYKTYYGLAKEFGQFTELAEVAPFVSQTNGGKFEADLYFDGGKLELSQGTIEEWLALKE